MRRKVSISRKKIKRGKPLNQLYKEYTRTEDTAEKYDDGMRMIDVTKTKENVVLEDMFSEEMQEKYRSLHEEFINPDGAIAKKLQEDFGTRLNEAMLKELAKEMLPQRQTVDDYRQWKIAQVDKRRANREVGDKRKLRSDIVDTAMNVVQPSKEYMDTLTRDEQVAFFKDALEVMKEDSATYGSVLVAVVHFDENSPHMQVLTSMIDVPSLTPIASKAFGNKTKMSKDQTRFVESLQEKGWDVQRGMQRIDNPDYQNFKSEMEQIGYEVNRHTDEKLYELYQQTQKSNEREEALDDRDRRFQSRLAHAKKTYADREKVVSRKESELASKQAELDKLEMNYRAFALNVTEREQQVKALEERVEAYDREVDARLTKRESELKQFEKELSQMFNKRIIDAFKHLPTHVQQEVASKATKGNPLTEEELLAMRRNYLKQAESMNRPNRQQGLGRGF